MRLTLLLLSMLSFFSLTAQDLVGKWKGDLDYNGMILNFEIDIQKVDTGYQVSMSVPKQSPQAFDASSVAVTDSTFNFEISMMGVSYKGTRLDAQNIDGTYYQSGMVAELDLTRGAVEIRRPQDPVEPLPYQSLEVSFENRKAQITLKGTLTKPKGEGQFPAVILINGSGALNRNSELMGHRPFLVIADHLTRNGIAVLRFDERGVGESGGEYEGATTYDLAEDVAAGYGYLKTRSDVDVSKIGLIGHSEGGMIAPMVAANNPEISFVIMLAGPAMPISDLMLLQKALIERKMGVSEMVIENGQKINSGAFEIVKSSKEGDTTLLSKLSAYYTEAYENELSDQMMQSIMDQMSDPWMINFLKMDPEVYLKNVKCPVLAINGDKDLQVPAENLAYLRDILRENGNKNIKIATLDDHNHLFQACETGLPQEYGTLEETFSPIALDVMTKWIKKRIKK